jgi:hypothetical protein
MKLEISGKEKTFTIRNPDMHCPSCDDGKVYEETERSIFSDVREPTKDEYICGVCNTKYVFDRIKKEKIVIPELDSILL